MTLFHRNICTKVLQKFAQNDNLCHTQKRATNALATHQWPSTQPTKGLSFMPLTADSKVCLLCNLEKPIHKFSRLSPNGLRQSRCNPCRAIVNKQKLSELPPEERERRRIKNLERRKVYVSELSEAQKRKALLKSKYGISLETFDTLLEQQGNKCALCSGSEPGGKHDIFHVDHCHSSGSVRGLLCHKCNIALGFLGDCQTAIQKALDYVTPSNFPEINQSWPFQSKGGRRA